MQLGLNPNQVPPSIVSLMKRVANGGRTPLVSELVALFNIQSLQAVTR
jgi:DNA/RNA-binding domain of Phe-tRNA-synthetase-like protein